MAAPPLPNQFFVYFPQRKAATDPFSGLVLLERDLTNPDPSAIYLKYPPKSKDIYELKGGMLPYGTFFGFYTLMGPADTTPPAMQATVKQCKGIVIVKKGSNTMIPVFRIDDISKRFDGILKRNVVIEEGAAPPTVISHVETTHPTKTAISKPVSPPKLPKPAKKVLPVGDLHPFVAKQLLEFAQSKKEMCPITAEEYITGETAAMPCGHLFMTIAITESFKKEPHRCPACRQSGRPTYV